MNKINPRREFDYASPDEVLPVLMSTVGEVVEYTVATAAAEFQLRPGTRDTTL